MLTTVAGGVVGVLGAVVGPWLRAWTDRQERSRQERRDAYAEFASAVHDLAEAMVKVQGTGLLSPDRIPAQETFDSALYSLTRRGALVQLLGPEAVCKASVELLDYVAERVVPLTGRVPGAARMAAFVANPQGLPEAERRDSELREASHQASEGLTARYDALMAAARNDLGTRS